MSAAQFICVESKSPPLWAIGGTYLAPMVFAVAGFVLVFLCWNLLGHLASISAANQGRRKVRA